jgi:signal transduction histidine kinase
MRSPLNGRFTSFPVRLRLPWRTARLRLTLLYECVSIVSWALRVALVGLLVLIADPVGRTSLALTLVVMSAIAIVVMAPVSMLVEWLIAGRVLRPLRTITATTREISATNLHQRLALHGPDDELKELSNTIDALLDRLQTSFESQRLFVANASHELRTPLARLKTLLEVALADPEPTLASMRLAQQQALSAEQQLEQLVDALLALARGGQIAEHREPLDLAAVTERVLQTRAREIKRRQLRASATLDHAWTHANQQLLERLVANLLDNAIAHNTPGGWLEVTSATSSGCAILTVANSGAMISSTDLERIQQPFQRLTTERTSPGDGRGLGLGLSIVAAILTAHGGKLKLDARPEGGLHVSVKLASAAQPPEEARLPAGTPSQPSCEPNSKAPAVPGVSSAG